MKKIIFLFLLTSSVLAQAPTSTNTPTYNLISISPNNGTNGSAVTLMGHNLGGTINVFFGTAASNITSVTNFQIITTSPNLIFGTYNVYASDGMVTTNSLSFSYLTPTPTCTFTKTNTVTNTCTQTCTNTATITYTNTFTNTMTNTCTQTCTQTCTNTVTPIFTPTFTPTINYFVPYTGANATVNLNSQELECGPVSAAGPVTLANLDVTGPSTLTGNVTMGGTLGIAGTLNAAGAVTAASLTSGPVTGTTGVFSSFLSAVGGYFGSGAVTATSYAVGATPTPGATVVTSCNQAITINGGIVTGYGPTFTPTNTFTPSASGGPSLQIVHKILAANVVTAVVTANIVYVSGSTAAITPTPGDYEVFAGGTTIGGYPLAIGTVTTGSSYTLIPATYIPTIQAGALAGVTQVMWISGSRSIPAYVSSTSNLTNAVSIFRANLAASSTSNYFSFYNTQTDGNYYQCGNGISIVGAAGSLGVVNDYPITQTTSSACVTYSQGNSGSTGTVPLVIDTWQLWGTK